MAIMYSTRLEKARIAGLHSRRNCDTLLSMDALCGWRDVRRTTRNNTDDVSGRFFMREIKVIKNSNIRWILLKWLNFSVQFKVDFSIIVLTGFMPATLAIKSFCTRSRVRTQPNPISPLCPQPIHGYFVKRVANSPAFVIRKNKQRPNRWVLVHRYAETQDMTIFLEYPATPGGGDGVSCHCRSYTGRI